MNETEGLEECKLASIEFFEYLLDRLGNPQYVNFYLHGSELQEVAKRLLGDYGISPINTYDLLSGTECSPWYNLSGPVVYTGNKEADFTPEKLLNIYRRQREVCKIAFEPTTCFFRHESSGDFVGLKRVGWSCASYAVDFDGFFVRAKIRLDDKSLLNELKIKTEESGVLFESHFIEDCDDIS
ncbi:MAG: hypothetical protein V1870_05695, partial [Candidatus Aenigmatarchaeota archaeon]